MFKYFALPFIVAVQDGTANINKKNVINVKCVNCKFFSGDGMWINGKNYLVCKGPGGEYELVPEYIALDEGLPCEMYVENSNDDTTKRS